MPKLKVDLPDAVGLNTMIARLQVAKGHRYYFKTGYWSSINDYTVFFSLIAIYRPDVIIECGTCSGASALAWSVGFKESEIKGHVYTWDPHNRVKVYWETPYEKNITYHHASFAEDAPRVLDAGIPGKKLFFIDGDHNYRPCLADFRIALKYATVPGDVIVLHDARFHEPIREAIREGLKDVEASYRLYTIPTRCGVVVMELNTTGRQQIDDIGLGPMLKEELDVEDKMWSVQDRK